MRTKPLLTYNLAWPSNLNSIIDQYKKWIDICTAHGIKMVRIILAPWGIYPFDNEAHTDILKQIADYAHNRNIEIVLAIDTYVNYCSSTYRDFENGEYGWKCNHFNCGETIESFLRNIAKSQYVVEMISLLKQLVPLHSIVSVELCNEIDQIEASPNTICCWINNTLRYFSDEFGERFIYRVSISNNRYYSYYSNRIKCRCDLHSYRYPYNTAIENIEYYCSKYKNVWLSEFSCFSDFAHENTIECVTYFSATMYESILRNLSILPAPWWWDESFRSSLFINILSSVVNQSFEPTTPVSIDIRIKPIGRTKSATDKRIILNKIKYRVSVLVKKPSSFIQEFPAIKKFLKKITHRKYNNPTAISSYMGKTKAYILVETYVPIQLEFEKKLITSNRKCICYDIIRHKNKLLSCDIIRLINAGTYLIIVSI